MHPARLIVALLMFSTAPAAAQDNSRPPQLRNAAELGALMREDTPAFSNRIAAGARVGMRLFVNDTGKVDSVRIASSSGLLTLDGVARKVWRRAHFDPALRDDVAVGTWIDVPVVFSRDGRGSANALSGPRLLNRDSVLTMVRASHPLILKDNRIGARVGLALTVDAEGHVNDVEVLESSCFTQADDAAAVAARKFIFERATPFQNGSRTALATVVYSSDSVRIKVTGDEEPPPPPAGPPRARGDGETRAPQLKNRDAVARLLVKRYPLAERDAGVGGNPVIWFQVDEKGRVGEKLVSRSSGNCRLDAAALMIADEMRFEPALNDGERTMVWVEIPIHFRAR